MKRAIPTEPFVDHHAQRVLIAGRARSALELFGRCIGGGPRKIASLLQIGILALPSMPKSLSHTSFCGPSSMFSGLISRWMTLASWAACKAAATCLTEEMMVASGKLGACGIALAEGTIGGVFHHQKGGIVLDPEVQHPHDVGVRPRAAIVRASLRKCSLSDGPSLVPNTLTATCVSR